MVLLKLTPSCHRKTIMRTVSGAGNCKRPDSYESTHGKTKAQKLLENSLIQCKKERQVNYMTAESDWTTFAQSRAQVQSLLWPAPKWHQQYVKLTFNVQNFGIRLKIWGAGNSIYAIYPKSNNHDVCIHAPSFNQNKPILTCTILNFFIITTDEEVIILLCTFPKI